VWIKGLPPEAATWRIDGQQWTLHDELLAVLIERVEMWGYAQAHLSADKKARRLLPEKPFQVPRPGAKPDTEERVVTDPKEIAAFFAA